MYITGEAIAGSAIAEEEDVRYYCYKQSYADLIKGNIFCHVILLFQNKVSELVFCSY
jgi:hypothetical protein